jgi:hypothetical protein
MHGNFDSTQTLDSGGTGVTVTGWVCWDRTSGEPNSCTVTVEIKQTSGPGSAKAKGTSGSYPKGAPGAHIQWSAHAISEDGDALHAGGAEAIGWIKDPSGHTVFQWSANPVTLQS